jgi:hypothetical protein
MNSLIKTSISVTYEAINGVYIRPLNSVIIKPIKIGNAVIFKHSNWRDSAIPSIDK